MALRTITLREELRPWRNAGVAALLLPEPLSNATLLTALGAGSPSAPASETASPSSFLAERYSAPHCENQTSSPAAPPVAPTARSGLEPKGTAAKTAPRETAVTRPPKRSGIPPVPLPSFETWPAPWRQAFAKTRPAPLVWTYHELGLDLAGLGSPGRGDFFRSLLAALHLPSGSSTFWPTAVPLPERHSPLTPLPEVFQAGLHRLGPRAILFLGEQGITDAGFQLQPLFQQYITQGRIVLHIPSLEALIADQEQRQVTISFLLSSLDFLL